MADPIERVLGLDAGGTFGYAHGPCGGRPIFGIIRLPTKSTASKQFVILEARLRAILVADQITKAYIELPFIQRDPDKININRELLAWGWQTVAGIACEKEGVPIFAVPSATWRSFFMGVTTAPKDCGAGLPDSARVNARRAWLKQKALEECQKRGWSPPETVGQDAAEAGGVWTYGCDKTVKGSTGDSTLSLLDMLEV